jgi:hypothetical protein
MTCAKCGSANTMLTTVKPPRSGRKPGESSHTCGPQCPQSVVWCKDCKMVRPV